MGNLIVVRWASFGSYGNPGTGDWPLLWTVPPACSFGMAGRPEPLDDTQRQTLPKVVTANAVRIEADVEDGMCSVSEIQLFGERGRLTGSYRSA
jgi:hypothetical protein